MRRPSRPSPKRSTAAGPAEVIRSTGNPRVRWVRQLQSRRRDREEQGVFLVEGARLAEEALHAGSEARLVLRDEDLDTRSAAIARGFEERGAEVLTVTSRVLAACSATQTAPGLLVVSARPRLAVPRPLHLAVVADGLADPGNLGSLMRTCMAAGVEALFLTPGTVDVYNPKVVRGAMGAHFHLPTEILAEGPVSPAIAGLQLWLAAPRAGTPYHRVDWRPPIALVIGSEAHGGDPAWRAKAAGEAHIPMRAGTESLNAVIAAAVILFEIARQRGSP
ncbi:MAG TPA: RNA methyltransferase [Anaerolineales bacterium]|nr:RNA methyltransferase [Anaerolineales bacterium]